MIWKLLDLCRLQEVLKLGVSLSGKCGSGEKVNRVSGQPLPSTLEGLKPQNVHSRRELLQRLGMGFIDTLSHFHRGQKWRRDYPGKICEAACFLIEKTPEIYKREPQVSQECYISRNTANLD